MRYKIFLLTTLLVAGFAADAAAQMARSDKTTFIAPKQKTNNASQEITWSVRTGLNVSNISNLDEDDMDFKAKAGFHIGVLVDIPVQFSVSGFSVQSGLFYTMRGAKCPYEEKDESIVYDKGAEKIVSHYFQIPIYWNYKYDFGSVAVSAFTGPYIAVGIAGKYKDESDSRERYSSGYGEKYHYKDVYKLFGKEFVESEYNEKKSDDDNEIYDGGNWGWKRFDIGWSLGAGVTFDRIYVGLQYDWGFVNMEHEDYEDYRPKNRNFSLSVGYTF